jgi:hypothetical protein
VLNNLLPQEPHAATADYHYHYSSPTGRTITPWSTPAIANFSLSHQHLQSRRATAMHYEFKIRISILYPKADLKSTQIFNRWHYYQQRMRKFLLSL